MKIGTRLSAGFVLVLVMMMMAALVVVVPSSPSSVGDSSRQMVETKWTKADTGPVRARSGPSPQHCTRRFHKGGPGSLAYSAAARSTVPR